MVEELVLKPPEEALHRRVVGAAPLLRHRPDQEILLADRNPPRPAIVASSIGVGHRALPFGKPPARGLEAGVGELCVRARPYRPGSQPSVEAVEDGREVDLAVRQPELRDVCEPQLVGRGRMEVAADQVLRRVGDLALVGAVPGLLFRVDDHEPLFVHDAAHHLLGYDDRIFSRPQLVRDVAVAARAVGSFEDLAHADAQTGVLVGSCQRPALVLIGALRYPQGSGELFQAPARRRPQLVYDQGFLPVRHRAGALGF